MDVDLGSNHKQRIVELRATIRQYQDRYGDLDGVADVAEASSALAVRQRRLDWLAKEYERVGSQMRSLRSEVERIERWIEFCLEDVVARAKRAHAEGWSPTPVLGYRLWGVGAEGLHGVKMRWPGRKMTATCLVVGGSRDIPHTDGHCGRLGCGVYAAKSVEPLYREFDVAGIGDVAVGLVALSGKVVEHEAGYRGAEAEVIALAACLGTHLLRTNDPNEIDRVFADPSAIAGAPEVDSQQQRLLEMEMFVEQQARRATPWTLANSNE
jgi:hypothetical protein